VALTTIRRIRQRLARGEQAAAAYVVAISTLARSLSSTTDYKLRFPQRERTAPQAKLCSRNEGDGAPSPIHSVGG
jgi:hypothetical protein